MALAAAFGLVQADHARIVETARDLRGSIRRTVGHHHDLEFLRFVVERQRILDLGRDDAFFVEGRDDQRDAFAPGGRPTGGRTAQRGQQHQRERIAHEVPRGQHERHHAQDFERAHGRDPTLSSSLASSLVMSPAMRPWLLKSRASYANRLAT